MHSRSFKQLEKMNLLILELSLEQTDINMVISKLGLNLQFFNYVAVENQLVQISKDVISLSKNLNKLQSYAKNNKN